MGIIALFIKRDNIDKPIGCLLCCMKTFSFCRSSHTFFASLPQAIEQNTQLSAYKLKIRTKRLYTFLLSITCRKHPLSILSPFKQHFITPLGRSSTSHLHLALTSQCEIIISMLVALEPLQTFKDLYPASSICSKGKNHNPFALS